MSLWYEYSLRVNISEFTGIRLQEVVMGPAETA